MPVSYQMDFERKVTELEERIDRAQRGVVAVAPDGAAVANGSAAASEPGVGEDGTSELDTLIKERDRLLTEIYTNLGPWDTVRVARHPNRPQGRDYIAALCRDFCELHGDRRYGDDPAMVTGFGRIDGIKCLIVAHHKGKTTQEKIACHFGCAHPEGYRKALAKMKLAEKFGTPIVTFVDTPGAYPGLGAEERGQAEAIAVNLREMSRLRVPIVSVVIGEGGSGGALGIAVADRVGMLAYAWYSVISPEGCAAILWKQANETTNRSAAVALKLTATDNLGLGIVDSVVPEPIGGAHRDPASAAGLLGAWVTRNLREIEKTPIDALLDQRYARFRQLGQFEEIPEATDETPEPEGDGPAAASRAENGSGPIADKADG